MTTTKITIKCGCGERNTVASITAEAKCGNCKNPLIYENPPTSKHVRTLSLARHLDVTVTLDSSPLAKGNR